MPELPIPSPPAHWPQTVAIAVVEHQGRYVIGQRPPGVPLAGLWEFPGGKVRADETPRQAAVRECLEETGLIVDAEETLAVVSHRYDHGSLELHFFCCRPRLPEAPLAPPYCWVSGCDLPGYRFPEANASVLALLARRQTP